MTFLSLLHLGLAGHVAWFTLGAGEGAHGREYWAEPGSPPAARLDLEQVNVWTSVCSFPARKRLKATACGVPGLWVDLDPPKNWCASDEAPANPAAWQAWRETALKELRAYRPEPSMIVDSGSGWQAYWLLDTPLVTEDADARANVESLLRALAALVHGDPAVAELARIMRVPGTLNLKPGRGPCRLVDAGGARYSLEQLAAHLLDTQPAGRKSARQLPLAEDLPVVIHDKDARMILEMAGVPLNRIPAGQRNDRVFRIAASLRARGMALSEMVRILDLVNVHLCTPSLSPVELEKIALSASHYSVADGYAAAAEEARKADTHQKRLEAAKARAEEKSADFEAATTAAIGNRETKLDLLARTFGVRIEQLVQVGRDNAKFYLEIRRPGSSEPERIYIGVSISQPKPIVDALLRHGVGAAGVTISSKRWPAILAALLELRIIDDDAEMERQGETRHWILAVVEQARRDTGLVKNYDAVRKRLPFEEDGWLYVNAGNILATARAMAGGVTMADVVSRLKEVGFDRGANKQGSVSARGSDEEGTATGKYWRCQNSAFIPTPDL